jgi:hypothetical protein
MPQVAVEKCRTLEAIPQAILDRIAAVADSIRNRAFDLFQKRNGEGGKTGTKQTAVGA